MDSAKFSLEDLREYLYKFLKMNEERDIRYIQQNEKYLGSLYDLDNQTITDFIDFIEAN